MVADLQQTSELLERTSAMAKVGGWELDLATMQVTYTTEAIRIHEFDLPYVPPTLSEGNKFYPPKAWPIIEAAVQAAIEHGIAYDLESPFITAKGRHIWVRVQGNAVRENGKTVKLSGIIQDITERKQTEEKLKFSEKRSLAYLENSPACTKILDLDFNLQYMSKAGVEGLNIDNIEDYYGKPYPFYFYPESFQKEMKENLVRAKGTGETITQEAAVVDVDGNEIWFHSTIVPVNDDQGEIDYLMVVSIDTTDRKQAEEELKNALAEKSLSEALLQASEAQIRAMLDQAPMGIALIDSLNGQLFEINQRFAEIVGRSREELLTLDWMTITHPEDIQPDLDNMARLNAAEISGFNMQKRYIHADTSIVWVSLTVAPIKVANKNRPRHLAMVEDITAKKQTEEVLLKQKYYLEKAQELGQIGAWDLDIINNTLIWTDQNCRIFGVPPGSVVNYEIFIDKVHPKDRDYVEREWSSAIHGKPYDIEHRIVVAGETKWVREKADITYDAKGNPVSAIGFTQDITETKQLQEHAKEHEDRFTSAFEFASIGMAIVSTDGTFVKVNKALCSMLGYSEEAFLSLSFMDITYPDDLTADMDNVRKMLCGEINSYQMEKRYIGKEGRLVWGLLSVSLVTDGRNQPKYFISQILDISERKQAEEELRRSTQLAALGTIVAGVAHEVNNPAQSIIAFSELLNDSPADAELVKKIGPKITQEGIKIGQIVKTALHFSRRSGSEKELKNLESLTKPFLKILRKKANKSNIILETEFDKKTPEVLVNDIEIEQAILNLVNNSIDAISSSENSGEKRIIRISLDHDLSTRNVRLVIFDNGPGIPQRVLDNVKDAFFTTKEVGKGTGLGLSIVDDIMKKHGGIFDLESVEGEYTKAILTFPYQS